MPARQTFDPGDISRATIGWEDIEEDREKLAHLIGFVPRELLAGGIRQAMTGCYPQSKKAMRESWAAHPDKEFLEHEVSSAAWAVIRWWFNVMWESREQGNQPVRLNDKLLPLFAGLKQTYADLLMLLSDYGLFELSHVSALLAEFAAAFKPEISRMGERGLSLPCDCVVRADLKGFFFKYEGEG